jgi:hypothetical protein
MAEDYSKLSDDQLLEQLNSGQSNQTTTRQAAQEDYSKMSDEDLLSKLNSQSTAADVIGQKEDQFQEHGGWKSFGKGLLSSAADIPNNVAQGLAWGSEKLDNFAGVDPLVTRDQVKGNWFDKQARSLEEPNAANYMGRTAGDLAISAVPAATLPKGASLAGKIGYDTLSGGLSGLATGGPEGAAAGAVTAGALSGVGRLAGLGNKPSGNTFGQDLKKVYNQGLTYAAAAPVAYGLGIPAGMGTMALPGVYTALRHVPQGIANGALRYGGSAIGGAGGGLLQDVLKSDGTGQQAPQPQQGEGQSPVDQGMNVMQDRIRRAKELGSSALDYGTRGGYVNKYFRGNNNNGY